jgi:hypothetical protein
MSNIRYLVQMRKTNGAPYALSIPAADEQDWQN